MKLLDRSTPTPTNEGTKIPRVSFATSPDKTIDSTPPSSPDFNCSPITNNAAAAHREPEDDGDEHEDDFVRASKRSALRVNRILCRVPSHESNISDLSASLSPSYVRTKPTSTASTTTESNNPIYALLNACGVADEFSDLISAHPSVLGSERGEVDIKEQRKINKMRQMERPAVWGLAPSMECEEESDEETMATSPNPSRVEPSSSGEIEYDNVELVLDEAALRPAAAPPAPTAPGRRSPINGILKKKVSGIIKSGRYSPKTASPPTVGIICNETRSTPQSAVSGGEQSGPVSSGGAQDHRISHTYDVALFQNETLRPSPMQGVSVVQEDHLVAATAAAAAAVAMSRSSPKGSLRSSPVDSITGEVNGEAMAVKQTSIEADSVQPVEPEKKEKKSKKSSTSLSSRISRSSKSSASAKSKSSLTVESDREESKKFRSKSMPATPSRKFLKGLPSFKRSKNVANKKKDEPQCNAVEEALQKGLCVETATSDSTGAEPVKKTMFTLRKSPSPQPATPEPTPPATPTTETIEDAKYWKSTLDPSSSKTYYYHSKTKVTTWDKPPGFDEAQKLKENKYWKATLDANSGQTYYYHTKTKEVTWTKPEGYVENSKKRDDAPGNAVEVMIKGDEKHSPSSVNDQVMEKALTPVEKQPCVENPTSVQRPVTPVSPVEVPKVVNQASSDQNQTVSPVAEKGDSATQPHTVERINSVEDAPFDEPTPAKLKEQGAPDTDNTFGSIPSMNKNRVQTTDIYKSIDFSTRTKTFMSQMTDKTPKFNNTTATHPTKDFTDTQIDVNLTTDATLTGGSGNANTSSLNLSLNTSGEEPPKICMQEKKIAANPTVAANPKGARRIEPPHDESFDEESAVFDDWSDEVSELSGIGNDNSPVKKRLLIGRNGKKNVGKVGRDARTEKSSSWNKTAQQQKHRNTRQKDFTQQELDSFIARNDWGSVSKYIAEMRNNKPKVHRSQPSRREIQEAIDYNRRMESNENGPRKRFGARSQMQHDTMDEEFSDVSPESESRSSNSHGDSSYEESGFTSYDESPRRSPQPRHISRRMVT